MGVVWLKRSLTLSEEEVEAGRVEMDAEGWVTRDLV